MMIEHKFVTGSGEYLVEMEYIGERKYKYTFSTPTQKNLFAGSDLRMGIFHTPENSVDAARTLLSFLTMQPGDIEKEYFDKYTPEQLAWAKSKECEQLHCEFDL